LGATWPNFGRARPIKPRDAGGAGAGAADNRGGAARAGKFFALGRPPARFAGPYHREVFHWLYRENRLATGRFWALGRTNRSRRVEQPLFLLAGERDDIAPPAQVFAAAGLVGTRKCDIETALAPCGHLALFMAGARRRRSGRASRNGYRLARFALRLDFARRMAYSAFSRAARRAGE